MRWQNILFDEHKGAVNPEIDFDQIKQYPVIEDLAVRKNIKRDYQIKMTEPSCEISWGNIVLRTTAINSADITADAIVIEEDTFLILSTKKAVELSDKSRMQLVRDTVQTVTDSPVPGLALARGKAPYRFLAIVHDFNETPSWKKEWVRGALVDIFEKAEYYSINSIRIPLLATEHGSLEPAEFVKIIFEVLDDISFNRLKIILLMVPEYAIKEVVDAICEIMKS